MVNDANRRELLQHISDLGGRVPSEALGDICAALARLPSNATAQDLSATLPPIADGRLRDDLFELASRWGQTNPDVGGEPLAWALLAANAADDRWRRTLQVETVWTGPTSHKNLFRRTEQALLEVISKACNDLWLVSFAGYKLPRVRDALLAAAQRGVTIRLVMESPEVSQGKVTFSTLEGLGSRLGEVSTVYVWPLENRPKNGGGDHGSLHVKCCLADDRLLFVTSANLTEFAMSLNMELGLLIKGEAVPGQVGTHLRWLVQERHLVEV